MNNNNLKAINIIHFDGKSISLNDVCMSHTVFQKGQILQASIYGDMIVITPALSQDKAIES
ncbi:hypothetical protein [Lacrimispora sp.]|uniref:hypothetical protein n=1 Tax=Lacrimispora sp. TaxID=2719234 RepID=UPI0028612ABB|nr:hypothetical protein [Lacrimispora sp.]MDR7814549.1 hypothetical protein [Lacrimispora sp.]